MVTINGRSLHSITFIEINVGMYVCRCCFLCFAFYANLVILEKSHSDFLRKIFK